MKRLFLVRIIVFFLSGCSLTQGVRNVREFFDLKEASELYNSETPDTIENKKSFEFHLGVPVSEDVRDILAYAELWTDSIYLFSFQAEESTIENILKIKQMSMQEMVESPIEKDLVWWDEDLIDTFQKYHYSDDRSSRVLWYDEKNKQAFYQEFQF